MIKAKILLQKLWERKIDWDEAVPHDVLDVWRRWRAELHLLSEKHMPRCYFPCGAHECSMQLHGFSDASEEAFAAVVYLRVVDPNGMVHVSLVMSKTRVAPLKRMTIPRLELCGAYLLSQILSRVKEVLNLPNCEIYAWTDSMVVLGWLTGDPRRFKPYVGNRVTRIVENIPSNSWRHVSGSDNPADCASRGLFPSELVQHHLWWDGPHWLHFSPTRWPQCSPSHQIDDTVEEICLVSTPQPPDLIDMKQYSSFTRLKRVTAWVFRFVNNCRSGHTNYSGPLSPIELAAAETHCLTNAQSHSFQSEVKKGQSLPGSSCLRTLHPFVDSSGLLRVGGRLSNASLAHSQRHPIIIHGKHPLAKLVIRSERIRLLHGGPTLTASSLNRRFHIIGQRKAVHSVTRACVPCRRTTVKPQPQLMGQLPVERVTPGIVFEQVGVNYAGHVYLKLGHVRKPTIVKLYICIFVNFVVKAVHIELVSDLTSAAFIACLRRFVSRRGKPSRIWSDHGSNFIGAAKELAELTTFLKQQKIAGDVSDFCSSQGIQWTHIPEHAPHFGGLWKSAVKSTKTHLKRILGNVKLTFEEFSTTLSQIEACLNSQSLIPIPSDEDGIEALTPGHFLVGRPLEAFPDPPSSFRSLSTLRRWNLCQALTRHFWKRWSSEYFVTLRKFTKWHSSSRNVKIGDVVLIKEDGMVPTKWPLGRIVGIYPGKDDIVRVVSVQTTSGVYRRPVAKIALLLATD